MWRIGIIAIAAALSAPGQELFEKSIRPVLAERCYGCHSAKLREPKANLRLDTKAGLARGGDSGPVLVPGKPSESLLYKAVSYTDHHLRMPPTGKLPEDAIAAFRLWIEQGAEDPRQDAAESTQKSAGIDWERARKFWAFSPLNKTAPPPVKAAAWPRGDADRFLLAKMEPAALRPAAPAGKREWLRRVRFALTGLPPSPEEVADYLSDNSPDADAAVVDRLLDSRHFGERWARHWLDLVRWAETNGHEYDNNKLDAWRYRDYVIRALNDNLPYDQFVREHIAGDLMAKPRISRDGSFLESPLATGFYWFGEVLNSATDSEKSRADTVDNQIDVITKSFLGLTVACARCHDHKFDPIPTTSYYGLAGIMHSTNIREAVIDSPARAAAVRRAHERVGQFRKADGFARSAGRARIVLRPGETVWEGFDQTAQQTWFPTGEAFSTGFTGGMADSAGRGAKELVGSLTSAKFRMPKRYVHIRMQGAKGDKAKSELEPVRVTLVADDFKSLHYLASGKPEWEWVTHRMTLPYERICYFEIVDRSREGHLAVDAIVFSDEKDPPEVVVEEPALLPDPPPSPVSIPESAFGMIAWDENPRDIRLHIRGNHQNLDAAVPRQFLRVLSEQDTTPPLEGSGRVELAEWLTGEARALTARVFVNRVWRHMFGSGLVRSADNFGLTGERPTHRELLDTLAAEFIESGWNVKALIRKIAVSAAFRMDASATPEAEKKDPRNELLSHFPVRRLEAEAVRDSILAVAGTLSPDLFGPSVVPHISPYQNGRGKPKSGPLDGNGRRSLYIQVRRNFLTPMMLAFDYPLPVSSMGVRGSSTVPSQALLLLNNEFVIDQAAKWAARVTAEADTDKARVERMFEEAFARPAASWEVQESLAFLRQGRTLADLGHVLFNSAEFLYVR
jgi:hypothetical protein